MSAVAKYRHRKIDANEFNGLRARSGLSIRDFMFVTGRHSRVVHQYAGEGTRIDENRPSMGDVLILELAENHPELRDEMIAIANRYSLGE